MSKPIVRKLTDLSPGERIARNIYRTELSRIEMLADLSACKKPVWISCFFDGTGNNYKEDGNGNTDIDKVKYSNIAKLGKFAHVKEDVPNRIYGIYAQGVGTPFLEIGDKGEGIDKATGMASAAKGQARISWMLTEFKARIDSHMPHVNQVNVAVFGFSRGAAQARAFVRQVMNQCGQEAEHLLWTKSGGNKPPRLVFYFLGIFDTVASVGIGGSRLETNIRNGLQFGPPPISILGGLMRLADAGGHADWANDLRVPHQVRFCEHFVAAHEVREKFPADSVREDQIMPGNCRETLYPGVHSDVGGGYESMTQEGRCNELSRIALCNMYLSAYAAGVPFKSPEVIMKTTGDLFEIKDELKHSFEAYMSVVANADRFEGQCISHMNNYYHWRWGRTERQRKNRKEKAALIAKGQAVISATPDPYMTTTDKEWEADVQSIAESKTGYIRINVYPHEDAIFAAWKGTLRHAMTAEKRALFDKFFDYYVHDSVAGFKSQMSDSNIGPVEQSRWSVNRKIFMGKRDKKFLYWRYDGWLPETSGTKVAMTKDKNQSGDVESGVA